MVTVAPVSTQTSTTNTERSSHERPTSPLCANLVPSSPSRRVGTPFRPRPLPRSQLQLPRRRPRSTVVRRHRTTTEAAPVAAAVAAATPVRRTRRRAPAELPRGVPRVAMAAPSPSTSPSVPCARSSDDFDKERPR